MNPNPRPSVIHDYIERDNRYHWHPAVEIRQRGTLVYAITAVQGYVQRTRANEHAATAAKMLAKGH